MSKVVLLGDLHFGVRGDSNIFRDFQIEFLRNILFPYLIENEIDEVWQFGDLFDKRKQVNIMTLATIKRELFSFFENHNIKLNVIMGNHDQFYRNTRELNSLREIIGNQYNNIKFYDNNTNVTIDNLSVDIIPWINEGDSENFLRFISESDSDVCFGHFEMSGFEMMKGLTIDKGMNSAVLGDYEKVFSGHYHTSSERKNVKYLGTPYELTWSDYDDQKGFYLFDTEDLSTEFIENPYTLHTKVIYDSNTRLDDFEMEHFQNKFVKIFVTEKEDGKYFEDFLDMVYKCSPYDISITENINYLRDIDEDDIDVEDSMSILLRSANNVMDESIDKDKLSKLLKELYTEAISMDS